MFKKYPNKNTGYKGKAAVRRGNIHSTESRIKFGQGEEPLSSEIQGKMV